MRMRTPGTLPAALALTLAAGCHLNEPPDLLRLDRLDPVRASAGDRVTLTGDGFPAGRAATVTFRGDLFRPGEEPQHDVRITLEATAEGRNAVTLLVDPAVERRFARAGSEAAHTTFRGDVRIAFQPGRSGLTEVAGTARGAHFDVLPTEEAAIAEERAREGARALAFLGMTASPDPSGDGLRVEELDPNGRAARAGVQARDLLVELDGVTVLAAPDVRVRGGQRTARASLERGDRQVTVDLDVQGLAPLGSRAWLGPASVITAACALLVLPMTPLGALLKWLTRLGRGAAASTANGQSAPPRPFESVSPTGSRVLAIAAVLVLAATCAAFARLALGRPVLSPELDLVVGPLGVSIALVATRAVAGARAGTTTSFSAGIASMLRTLSQVVPALVAVVGAVVATGRFVVGEMVADQGGVPWRWAAAQNPGLFVLAALLLASVVPESDSPGVPPVEGLRERPAPPGLASTLVRLAEWAYLWTMCGLAVLVFFGGPRVPGMSSLEQESSRAFRLLGAALFFVKLGGLVVLVGALRSAAERVRIGHVAGLGARHALPASVVAAAFAVSWAAAGDGARSDLFQRLAGYSTLLFALAVVFSVVVARWSRGGRKTILAVNPWL